MQSIEEHRDEKAKRIAEVVSVGFKNQYRLYSKLTALMRKAPRIKSKRTSYYKRRAWRKNIFFVEAELTINSAITHIQIQMICSQPIPKFKPGGINNNEQAEVYSSNNTISECKQEHGIMPGISNPYAIQPLPTRQRDNI